MKLGWKFQNLVDVAAINYGYTESASSEPVGPRFLRITDIQDDRVDWDAVPYCKIQTEDIPKYQLASGDIVFARTGATTGKSFLVEDPPESVFASYLIRVRLHLKELLPEFVSLFFQTNGYWKSIRDGSAGSAQGGFNATKLGALSIPIPPIAEQQRIVGILDGAFAGIATAKANAEKNLQNSRALFECHVQSVFTRSGERWVEKLLCEWVLEISTGPFGSLLHKSDYQHGGIPLINPINIVADRITSDDRKAVGMATAKRLARYALRENDIVIARRGEIGRCAVVARDQAGWICGTGCFVIRPSENTNPHFLSHLLRSRPYREQLQQCSERATMPSISNEDLASLNVRLPPLSHQRRLLEMLSSLSVQTHRLELLYQHKLEALEMLKKSILDQAFTGRL